MTRGWFEKSALVVARVCREHKDSPKEDLIDALKAAYPFGLRQNYPYQQWCKAQKLGIQEWEKMKNE